MTGGAGWHVGFRQSLVEDYLAQSEGSSRRPCDRSGIEMPEMVSQSRNHRGTQRVRDILHHRIGTSALDEGPQLAFDVLRLLSGQSRHRKPAAITLAREAV